MIFLMSPYQSFSQADQKPNILFIAVDDLKPNIACFGDSLALTPNIDALASKGMVFSKAYCQQAVCAPSRASLLTSRYPDQTEIWDLQTLIRDKNPDILTLPQYFKQNGYNSYGVGKIFDYRSVENNDEISWNKYGNPHQSSLYDPSTGKPKYFYALKSAKDTITLLENEAIRLGVDKKTYVEERYWPSVEKANVPYNAYIDGAVLNEGINLMNQLNVSGKPFFLAVGFQRPHLPFNAPEEFWDLYNREDFKLAEFQEKSKNGPTVAYHNFDELRSYTDIPNTGNISEDKQLELIHAYYASVSYIDFLIGKLTQRLEELDLAKNTIIVLWGDHGWHLGDHNLWCKHSNFEEATRSPLILSYPGQPNSGTVYNFPTEFADIGTTLAELTGLPVPLEFEGESLITAIENPEKQLKVGALSQYPRSSYMGYSLRTERYRYTKWVNKRDGTHYTAELYDYITDPLETENKAFLEEYTNIRNELDSIVQSRIKTPSTQEKIKFEIFGVSTQNDTTAINSAAIFFEGNEKQTDSKGELQITHVTGEYTYSVAAKGYKKNESPIEVKSDTIVKVFLEQELYRVGIKVMGEWNNKYLENAEVSLNNQIRKTNTEGGVSFEEIEYNKYNIQVELENGFQQLFSDIEIFSDTSVILMVQEPVFNVDIQVVNKYTEKSIYETNINISDLSASTNSEGIATIAVTEGKHFIEIQHPKYSVLKDSFNVKTDTLFTYQLTPAFSTIKIKLSENTTPVNNATVTIEEEERISNGLGNVFFKEYPTFTQYNYKIEKEKYNTLTGSLYLINDTTINIQMQAVSTGILELSEKYEIKIWPNPVIDILYFQIAENYKIQSAEIIDLKGTMIKRVTFNDQFEKQIETAGLNEGIYLLKLTLEDGVINRLIVKRDN